MFHVKLEDVYEENDQNDPLQNTEVFRVKQEDIDIEENDPLQVTETFHEFHVKQEDIDIDENDHLQGTEKFYVKQEVIEETDASQNVVTRSEFVIDCKQEYEIETGNVPELDDLEPKRKRIKIPPKKWVHHKTFQTKAEADSFIKSELCWSLKNTNSSEQGQVKYFRCNRVKSRGEQCTASIKLILDSSSNSTILYRADKHSCASIPTKATSGISEYIKDTIENLYKKKMKPKAIFENLLERFNNPPSIQQINNYLVHLRKSSEASTTISLSELVKWLQTNSEIPDDFDSAFVLNYVTRDQMFRFVISTKRLLENAIKSDDNLVLHADATFNLTWQGFPVFLLGTTDYDRKFHLLGISVCVDENPEDFEFIFKTLKSTIHKVFNIEIKPKVLITDAESSVKDGFKKVFEDCLIRTCWAYMRKSVQKKVSALTAKPNVNKILTDIDFIQLSEDSTSFSKSCDLFLKKWSFENKFVKYFKEEWIDRNSNWYEGICARTPSTNSALESTNHGLRVELRERLPLARFSSLIIDIVQMYSKKYTNDSLKFSETITYDTKLWASAYKWTYLNKIVQLISEDSDKEYMIPSGDKLDVNRNNLIDTDVEDFDEYVNRKSSFYKLYLPKEDWKRGRCTCATFFKKYVCEHILGLAIRFSYVNPPEEIKQLETGEKRKRGRPTRAKKALIVR